MNPSVEQTIIEDPLRVPLNQKKHLIVAGSRGFVLNESHHVLIKEALDYWKLSAPEMIITGECKDSPDSLGKSYAKANGIRYLGKKAQWRKFGRGAGPRRNREMALIASPGGYLIAFWNGKSTGTQNMINEAREKDLHRFIYILKK